VSPRGRLPRSPPRRRPASPLRDRQRRRTPTRRSPARRRTRSPAGKVSAHCCSVSCLFRGAGVHCADSNSLFVCRAELLLHNQHKGQCAVAAAAAAAAEATAVLALQVEAFLQTPADHSTLHSTLRDFYLLRIYVLPKHGDNFLTVF